MEYSPAWDLANSPRTREGGPRPDARVGKHSPLVCEAIPCPAPVCTFVLTCGRQGGRNSPRCLTRPAPVCSFLPPRQSPCPLGVCTSQWRYSRGCKSNLLGESFPECTCVRVSQVCEWVCARVRGPVGVNIRVGSLFRDNPFLILTPSFARPQSLLPSGVVREAGVPTPLCPHHSPSATCAAAPAPARLLLLQRGHLRATDPPAPEPAPLSRLPAPARPGLAERGRSR